MNKGFVLTTLMLICGAMMPTSAAVEVADSTSVDASATFSIIEHISTNSTAKIHQSDKLAERLKRSSADSSASSSGASSAGNAAVATGGYRIRVYSDNGKNAQSESRSRAATISSQFPQWASHVTYSAPYWRLSVGDFRSYSEASAALAELKRAFPAYQREMRLVRERIVTTAND
jgi:hypothetical protein